MKKFRIYKLKYIYYKTYTYYKYYRARVEKSIKAKV